MAKNKELSVWRASHFDEIEKTLSVLKKIRDGEYADDRQCPHCKGIITWRRGTQKDIIEACKGILRSLDAVSPAKAHPGDGTTALKGDKPTLSKEHASVLDDILGKL